MTGPAYRRIPIAAIDVPPGRLAAVRPERVETIGKTSRVVGQIQAINVMDTGDGRFALLAGAKRLAALDLAGDGEIDARVHPPGLDGDGRLLIEILENLDRQSLTMLERAEHLSALKAIHERLHPASRKGGDRRSAKARAATADQSEIFSFSSSAAELTGLSRRAIEIAVAIVAGLAPNTKARVRSTWIEDHQATLRELAALDAAMQPSVCDLLLVEPAMAGSVADALTLLRGGRLKTPAEKMFASTLGNWARFTDRQQAEFLDANEAEVRAHAKRRGWF